ncbi:hypothetical protein MBLNU13_g00332t1 [Cladosporium sp. NU13]
MADDQLTPKLSEMSSSASEVPQKLPNLPLPRELRDQIYSYLLDGEYVRTKRTWSRKDFEGYFDNDRSGPQAYHCHTNILGVNHAIHDEAEELLYKRNMFVILSYDYIGLGKENGGLFWLPIVSNKHAARMKSHSVCIHASPGTAGVGDPMTSGTAPMQSAILLARDLDAICLVLTTAGGLCTQTNLAVTLYRDGAGVPIMDRRGSLTTQNLAAPQFKCELRNTKYRQIDEATQRGILAPMARILAPSQRVSFKGIVCDFQEVEHLKQAMGPSLNCCPAYKWAFFEALSLAKDVADAAFPRDDISFVMALDHTLALTLGVCTYTHVNDLRERQAVLITCPEAVEACEVLALEAYVNAACCAVKARDRQILREAGEGIQESMKRRTEERRSWENVSPQLERLCSSVMLWKKLYCGTTCDLPTIREVVESLTSSSREPHSIHDSEILLRQSDQETVVTAQHLPLDQCSAFQLPLPDTSHHKTLLKQDRFKGWLDMDLLRSLDEVAKRSINKQQKNWKIKVTAFDELLQ